MRIAIFFVLLGAHMLGVLYFASLRGPAPERSDNGFATTVFFVQDRPQRPATEVTKLTAPSPRAPTSAQSMPRRPTPPQTPVPPAPETTAPITIDWAQEAERVAADRIEADAQARRRASRLSAGEAPNSGARPAPRPQFGWDYAHTHRFESLPGGGLVVNLSDRCALVFAFPVFMGGCKIGKIEARADLFTHMHDPPAPEDSSSR
ncbi:MAG TPA: hypothetical protein VIY90_22915 [Steroidobacteraceae bacterium]